MVILFGCVLLNEGEFYFFAFVKSSHQLRSSIGLTFDFVRDLIAHPEKAQELPGQAEIEFIEKDFEERQIQEADKKVLVIAPSSA